MFLYFLFISICYFVKVYLEKVEILSLIKTKITNKYWHYNDCLIFIFVFYINISNLSSRRFELLLFLYQDFILTIKLQAFI